MKITKGKKTGATKFTLYAPEGFGKSTFASRFPDPLYIDTEGGTKQLDIRRFDIDQTWADILDAARYVEKNPDCCKTLVLDTVDWAEKACIAALNKKHGTENILTMDYGKGSLFVASEFQKLIDIFDRIIDKGISVVMLAHAAVRKQELPEEIGAFDHWELKLQSKQVKSMVKEWTDILIFGNYKTMVYKDEKTKTSKAQGNERVMYTEHHPCWDAKHRHGLKAELPFDYREIKHIFEGGEKPKQEKPKEEKPKPEKSKEEKPAESKDKPQELDERNLKRIREAKIPDTLKKLMLDNGVAIGEIETLVAEKGHYSFDKNLEEYDPEYIQKMLIDKWDGLYRKILKDRENNPFR